MTVPDPVVLFSHERLDVYRRSIEFLSVALQLASQLPRGHSAIADQLRRAATSIPLNIAEGTGRNGNDDKRRHYAIARGSALECAALLDVIRHADAAEFVRLDQGRQLLIAVVQMLSRMSR